MTDLFLLLPRPFQKRLHIDDLDAVEVLEVSEVWVTGDDVIGLCLHCAGEEFVIRRVVSNLVNGITACGN